MTEVHHERKSLISFVVCFRHYCVAGTTLPITCPAGYYCPESTGPVWQSCPPGTFSNTTGLAAEPECTDCSAGKLILCVADTCVTEFQYQIYKNTLLISKYNIIYNNSKDTDSRFPCSSLSEGHYKCRNLTFRLLLRNATLLGGNRSLLTWIFLRTGLQHSHAKRNQQHWSCRLVSLKCLSWFHSICRLPRSKGNL